MASVDTNRCAKCVEAHIKDFCEDCFARLGVVLREDGHYPFDEKKWKAWLTAARRRNASAEEIYTSIEYVAFTYWWEERDRAQVKGVTRFWNLPEHMDLVWQRDAMMYVRKAVARGILPDLRNRDIACVDCGDVATVYEHRSYSRPLDVEPVCRPCNGKRGTAHWPSAADFNFKRLDQG